jgi:hypothetical protein
MEKTVEHYKNSVKRLLATYESLRTEYSRVELVFDDLRLRYMAVRVGWMNRKRIHLCLIHIDICDETIVIQCNNTEDLIVADLEDMGIPRQRICFGFLPPEVRALEDPHKNETVLEHFG